MSVSARLKAKDKGKVNAVPCGETASLKQLTMKEGKYMYVPPFDSILQAIGMTRTEYEASSRVSIPTELLKLLLQLAVANSDFNEVGYLRENPDIADAVRSAIVDNPRLHYVGYGFFEGRLGATPEVADKWYLQTYTDVADGIKSGQVGSAAEHFRVAGASEGRSPSPAYTTIAEQWKLAFRPSANM